MTFNLPNASEAQIDKLLKLWQLHLLIEKEKGPRLQEHLELEIRKENRIAAKEKQKGGF